MRFSELFYIHKSDRQVLLALLTVAAIAIVAICLLGQDPQLPEEVGVDSLQQPSAPLRPGYADEYSQDRRRKAPIVYRQAEELPHERFVFDPNTADSTQLLSLGLQPWQVRNIYKFRSKGGVYRKKSDFARLYGLTAKQYRELEPYIRISPDYQPAATLFAKESDSVSDQESSPSHPAASPKLAEGETIDLNTADTVALKRVPGIGSYFARRIASYRKRLGGFVSTEQLAEIEGFPPSAKTFFTVTASAVHRFNINRLTLNELKRHPYMNYYRARAIVDHRRLSGPIHDLSELRLLPEFPSEVIERLRPYVAYE